MLIKKRYLVILSVAVVCVLLGSLLYAGLVLAGKPEPTLQKDAVEIDVFGWVTRLWQDGREFGIYVHIDFPVELAFVFSPKQSSFNITNLIVVIYATNGIDDFTLTINGIDTFMGTVGFPVDLPSPKLIQLDPNLIPINEGINPLQMSGTGNSWLSVHKLSLFIEYRYQAR